MMKVLCVTALAVAVTYGNGFHLDRDPELDEALLPRFAKKLIEARRLASVEAVEAVDETVEVKKVTTLLASTLESAYSILDDPSWSNGTDNSLPFFEETPLKEATPWIEGEMDNAPQSPANLPNSTASGDTVKMPEPSLKSKIPFHPLVSGSPNVFQADGCTLDLLETPFGIALFCPMMTSFYDY